MTPVFSSVFIALSGAVLHFACCVALWDSRPLPGYQRWSLPYRVLSITRQWINQNLNPNKIATYPSSSRPSDFYIKPLHSRLGVMSKVYLLALRNSPINCCFLSLVSSLSCAFFAKRAFIFLRFLLSLRSCPTRTIDSCDWNLCWKVQSYMLPLRWRKKWQIASC